MDIVDKVVQKTSINNVDKASKLERVRWQCRRGALELDMMLQCFCDSVYSDLAYEQQQKFEGLLGESDTDLQRWLIKAEVCDKVEWQDLIMVIRHQYAMQQRLGK